MRVRPVAEATAPVVWRLRAVAVCVALTALAFIQAPGVTVPDTKVDLTVDPAGWLGRALSLWTPTPTFGQLQNQAYGYLWPMGPFFLGGSRLGVPGWVLQRLWWALLMCVAFTGLLKLAGKLGIGTPTSRLIAAAAFALSPRILTQLGTNSVESWPTAVAPWVLVPLIGLAKGESLRRAVTLSALAVACAGGVNATAVLATLPLAVLWLATLRPVRYRLRAIGAWLVAVLCACAWWLLPLLVLGAYSPPFLDYIENAEVTTRLTDVVTNLRGTSYWLAYLSTPFGPSLPAGWRLTTETVLIVATLVVAAFGLVGLSRRGTPHRRFLVTGLLVGVGLIGLGHASALPGGLGELGRTFLDGAGSPLRNVHKFDVLIRLPLSLGLAAFLGLLGRAGAVVRGPSRPLRVPALLATGTAVAAVVGVATPALAGGLAPPGGFRAVPGYWQEAADWFRAQDPAGRVLVVPGAGFPRYRWGATTDEIVQPLMDVPWAVRNAIPVTPPATIRLLDAVEDALADGSGSAGLAPLLARSGVRYVLLRSDLDYGRSGSTRPLVARQALERSPGLTPAAGFGPVSSMFEIPTVFSDRSLDVRLQALEVFRVDLAVDQVVAYHADSVQTVVGGPESLLELAASGHLGAAPAVLAGDLAGRAPPGPVVLTDGLRRRDVAFGSLLDNTSATMTADERFPSPAPAHDYLPAWADGQLTTVRYEGISGVRASTSWERTLGLGGRRPEYQPYAALDGDLGTAWRSSPDGRSSGQWLELTLAEPRTISEVSLRFDTGAQALPTRVTVSAGIERSTVEFFADTVTVPLPGVRASRTVRITVDSAIGPWHGIGAVGITEVSIPGLRTGRTLAVPAGPAVDRPASVVLSAAPATPACYFYFAQPRCSPDAVRRSEDGTVLDRSVVLPAAGSYAPAVWARARPGAVLDALLDRTMTPKAPAVSASSTGVADAAARPGVVLDGDPATAWSPAANDANPLLHIAWPEARQITGIRLSLGPGVAASRVGLVRIVGDDGIRGGFLDEDGLVAFDPPMRTDEITIMFLDSPTAQTYDPFTDQVTTLPVAVSEVTVLPGAANTATRLDTPLALPCGSGPRLVVGRAPARTTQLVGTIRDLWERREMSAVPCGDASRTPLSLGTGELRVVASASDIAVASRVALTPLGTAATATATPVRVTSWAATRRTVDLEAATVDRVLAVRENTNPGWRATVAGQTLTPIVVDGWQQGWLIPAGMSGEVVLRFTPETPYRLGLVLGGLLLLGVAVLAALPVRRRGAHVPRPVRAAGAPTTGGGRLLVLLAGGFALVIVGGAVGGALVLAGGTALAFAALHTGPTGIYSTRGRWWLRLLESWLPLGLFGVAGWLWLSAPDPHHAAGPQLTGLLAVTALWLGAAFVRVRRPASPPPHDGPFHQVVAQRGEEHGQHQGQRERTQHVSGEQLPVAEPVDRLEHEELPEEQAVRHRS